jgi:hypothetical protein
MIRRLEDRGLEWKFANPRPVEESRGDALRTATSLIIRSPDLPIIRWLDDPMLPLPLIARPQEAGHL